MEEDDTVEIIDYLRVIWKWRLLIIILTIACALVAGFISHKIPKIYEVSMVIEPGIVDTDPTGRSISIDSITNIKSKIDSQAYNLKIYKRLNVNCRKMNLKFKTIFPKNSNTLKISLEANDTKQSIQALSALSHELTKEYQHYVDLRKSQFDQEIAMNQRQIDIAASEKQYLEKEIGAVKANTNRIIKERDTLMKKRGNNPDNLSLSLLIYSNIIQESMASYNNLNRQLRDLMAETEIMKSKIDRLKIKKQSIENIKLIQPPQSSIYPIKPNKKLNVILVFVVGLFFSIFLAFFLEYLRRMRIHLKSSSAPDKGTSGK